MQCKTLFQKEKGGMVAVLGSEIEIIEKIIKENKINLNAEIANDNSEGQIVLSGKNRRFRKIMIDLKENKIKNIKLTSKCTISL
jgi:[acyl-carrier-protein] S-malonyltransferase